MKKPKTDVLKCHPDLWALPLSTEAGSRASPGSTHPRRVLVQLSRCSSAPKAPQHPWVGCSGPYLGRPEELGEHSEVSHGSAPPVTVLFHEAADVLLSLIHI